MNIFIDGGSRGNPGPAAIGVFFKESNKQYSQYLGKATNNEAEYQALIFAFKKAKALLGKDKAKKTELNIFSDSELLIKQQLGKYKIKEPNLQCLFIETWNARQDFYRVNFTSIPREENKIADTLVNQELDKQQKTTPLF